MSRSWRIAHSLEKLLTQVNEEFPHRRKDSDGGIGDERHQAERTSDHNPYIVLNGVGIVRAYDFTHTPETGFDSYAFAETLRVEQDHRVRYIISNRRIASGAGGPSPWSWRKYNGVNPHDHHAHVSVSESVVLFDDDKPWSLHGLDSQIEYHASEASTFVAPPATLRIGSRGELVKTLQRVLGIKVDGYFGRGETYPALWKYQKANNLSADGVCGPQTWKFINS